MDISGRIKIEECGTVELLAGCVELQRRVFAIPEIEISPVRHFIVTKHAGGFTLGAFLDGRLIGFSLSIPAVLDGEKAFYSHMTAIDGEFQGLGIGARLKWSQRERSLAQGINAIKWTFQPEKARNAYFNLEKLGAEVREYMPNFYGTDYGTQEDVEREIGIDSDRLFAVWRLDSEKVAALARRESPKENDAPAAAIRVPPDWETLVRDDRALARSEQARIRSEFTKHLSEGLTCRGFQRDHHHPSYLFFSN